MKQLLKNKKFLILWESQVASLLTINLLNFLVIVRVFEITNSTIASSFIWVAYAVPAIIVGPFAAAAVDLYDRRKIVIVSNLLQSLLVLFYAFMYQRYLYLSYGVIAIYSLINQLYVPAETAILTRIVNKNLLVAANSVFFVSQQSATIIAFGLAGIASEYLGFRLTSIIASVILFTAFLGTLFLPKETNLGHKKSENIEDEFIGFLSHMRDGFHFIRYSANILYPFLFLVLLQIVMSVLVVNLPAVATEIVKTKPALAGPLVVLPAGLGAIFGTILVTRLAQNKYRKKDIVHSGLVALSVAFLGVSLLLPILPFWPGRLLLIVLFLGAGFAFVATLVPTLTFLQEKTPKNMAGRVFGNFWFVTTALTVLPVIFSATITEILGVRLMLFSLGALTLTLYLISKKFALYKITNHEN